MLYLLDGATVVFDRGQVPREWFILLRRCTSAVPVQYLTFTWYIYNTVVVKGSDKIGSRYE